MIQLISICVGNDVPLNDVPLAGYKLPLPSDKACMCIRTVAVGIRHHQILLIRVPEQITEDQRLVTNLLLN